MRSRYPRHRHFNPRAPQGARPSPSATISSYAQFQSTRSARSATEAVPDADNAQTISIHALRRERDYGMHIERLTASSFQSTHSAGSATCSAKRRIDTSTISIHALRRERDRQQACGNVVRDISIHALRRERDDMTRMS